MRNDRPRTRCRVSEFKLLRDDGSTSEGLPRRGGRRMRIERTKEWWLRRARREGNNAISAGKLAFDPAPDERTTSGSDERRIAFGRFVNLMRRRRGLSVEQLA